MKHRSDDLTHARGPEDAPAKTDEGTDPGTDARDKAERPTRRRVVQGAALTAAAIGGAYVKPGFRSFGLPVAHAISGAPSGPAPDGSPCTQNGDCASNYCKDEGAAGMVCSEPDIISF